MADERPERFRPALVGRYDGGERLRAERGGPRHPPPTSRMRVVRGGAIAFVALLLLGPFVARRLTDWLWFRDLGYERVFLLKVLAQWMLAGGVGLVAAVLLAWCARAALTGADVPTVSFPDGPRGGERFAAGMRTRLARTLAVPVVLLLALLLAAIAGSEWRTLVQFAHRTPFGVTDPVFGRDVAYYVFTVPVVELVLDLVVMTLLCALFAITLPIGLATGEIGLRAARSPAAPDWPVTWEPRVAPRAARRVAVLVALLMLATGLRLLFVAVPDLLRERHGSFVGAGWTDLHVLLPALRATGVLAIAAAIAVVMAAWRGRLLRTTAWAVGIYAAAALLLRGALPVAIQRLVVQPNELAREAPQLVHHIQATRRAWGIDQVVRRELDAARRLTGEEIAANRATISNVRLWDREPLLQTFGQIQAIRTYYDFVGVDDDRYVIGGELRQVMLSPRELDASSLPTRSFINEHLTFTHGMGITLGPSNQVTGEGLPVLWVKDLPPQSSVNVRVTRPQIYFGELSNEFVLAPTRQREFDYPAGEGDAAMYSTYAGGTGVPVGSFARRLLFALRFNSFNILLSRDLLPETRILYHRNVRERSERALPFLRFDGDPYVVVTDSGRLTWVLDAYTATDRYPYSQPLADGTNYLRNSVKVLVDAYDGRVRAYVGDPVDPMVRTLSRIYPGLLRPMAEMPADVRAHLRYPEDLFRAQTALYATFHMTDPETFYHREDQWAVPVSGRGDGTEGFMRHIVMRLPGEAKPEFILMRPFTPRQKDNLAAWMVARNDGAHYGELVAYRFPRQSLVFGPQQIVNRINQDTEVARQVSLWDQRGSEVIRGELLVIPIEESLIYVQPLYLRAEGGRIPELKRVIVAHEGQVAMEETLEAGLQRLFGTARAGTTPRVLAAGDSVAAAAAPGAAGAAPAPGTDAELLRQAGAHYERARAAQRADDWATYGEEMRKLGEALRRLEQAAAARRPAP